MKTQKTFFFAALLIGLASVSILNVFADSSVVSTQRYRDWQVERLSDGSFRQTLGMVPYVWNGSQFVDRIIQNNGTHFNVYSEMGSFSFNKSSCSITQYVQGFDPSSQAASQSDIMIKDWFWTIARKNGTNPWQVIDASLFNCSISTSQNSTGKYLTMTRTDLSSGSYLKVNLAAKKDQPMEDYAELYMNKAAWTGNKFAFVLWAKDVKIDTLKYRNGTGIPIQDGVKIINKSQLTVDSMNFIKKGNAFFVDWKKAAPYLKTIILNKTNGITDVQFGFNDNPVSLNMGEKIYLDPTYGYNAATTYRSYAGGQPAGATCSVGTTIDTAVGYYITKDGNGGGGTCGASEPRWNISTIPTGAPIINATIRYDIDTATNMGTESCSWKAVQFDPSTASAATIFNDAQNGTTFTTETTCRTIANDKIISLHSSGNSDIQTAVNAGQPWWAVGLSFTSMARDAVSHTNAYFAGASSTELQVTYNLPPPSPVTDLHATDITMTTVDLAWTAPALNGGTLQRYVINYTSPCGIPTTHLANGTTATSYSVSPLISNTCYSFRVSAATEGGYNTNGANILNVTTLAFNQANYTIGSFNFNANNPLLFPIRYERIDNGSQARVNVTFTNTFSLACDLRYTYAGTNHTYHTISSIPVSSSENEASFRFLNSTNDIVTFHCWNQLGNQSANYVLTQTDFLLKQQVRDFRNGTYGTMGQFGAFDFISLVVVIITMIGLNRTNEAVGGFFCIVGISALAYFDIVSWSTVIISAVIVVLIFAIASTRKD